MCQGLAVGRRSASDTTVHRKLRVIKKKGRPYDGFSPTLISSQGGREELVQSISPFSPHLEQPLPVFLDEAWGQLVPEHVKS
jgi:hypothetical protein